MHALSFLDKLVGGAGRGADARPGTMPRQSLEDARQAVARDIERVLNARRPFAADELAAWPHVARALPALGLVDFAALSLASERDRRRIAEAIRDGLATHDRRLADVAVEVRPLGPGATRLGFAIRARLRLAPGTEPVAFDAVLQPGSLRYEVAAAGARPSAA